MTVEHPELIDAKFIRVNTDFSHNLIRFLNKATDINKEASDYYL